MNNIVCQNVSCSRNLCFDKYEHILCQGNSLRSQGGVGNGKIITLYCKQEEIFKKSKESGISKYDCYPMKVRELSNEKVVINDKEIGPNETIYNNCHTTRENSDIYDPEIF